MRVPPHLQNRITAKWKDDIEDNRIREKLEETEKKYAAKKNKTLLLQASRILLEDLNEPALAGFQLILSFIV